MIGRPVRTRSSRALWCCLATIALVELGGCGAGQAIEAPIQVIPRTDVVIETNVQSALQGAQATLEVSGSFAGFGSGASGGTTVTPGPSSGPGEISYAATATDSGIVLVGWNSADRHCVGTLYVHSPLSSPVLGRTATGQYDFVAPASTSSNCSAANFLSTASAPSGWPEDPSSSGWPPG